MAKVKEKKIREKFNWKKELKLAPVLVFTVCNKIMKDDDLEF